MNEDTQAFDRVSIEMVGRVNLQYSELDVARRRLTVELMKVVELRKLNDRLEAIFEMMSAADDKWRGRD